MDAEHHESSMYEMRVPSVDPVGVVGHPQGWTGSTRSSPGQRLAAAVLVPVFSLVTLLTGAISLGEYCSTSDGGDRRALVALGTPSDVPESVVPGEPTVVVELFTSQGCSSCPPADRLLSSLAADDDLSGRVVPLAFHVDYWNHIGWTDPFSSERWSDRQRRYAAALDEDRIYTPQLVVDGRSHVVGSKGGDVRRRIAAALAEPDGVVVGLAVEGTDETVLVDVTVRRRAAFEGTLELWVAVYEDGLLTPVERGENGGRQLANDRVVRSLHRVGTLQPDADGLSQATSIPLDPAWRRDRLGVVAFVQDPIQLAIHGAAAARSIPGS